MEVSIIWVIFYLHTGIDWVDLASRKEESFKCPGDGLLQVILEFSAIDIGHTPVPLEDEGGFVLGIRQMLVEVIDVGIQRNILVPKEGHPRLLELGGVEDCHSGWVQIASLASQLRVAQQLGIEDVHFIDHLFAVSDGPCLRVAGY